MYSVVTRVWLLLLTCIMMGNARIHAQSLSQHFDRYSFLDSNQNYIGNHQRGMKHFYRQLAKMESGQIRTINVVHIGDSHIQADWFSGEVRRLLQQRFGSAGRGLVFPYSLAKTNSPGDIHSYSNVSWQVDRVISRDNHLPIGLSGITMRTYRPDFSLKVSVDDAKGLDYSFNKVTVFTGDDQDHVDLLASTTPLGPQARSKDVVQTNSQMRVKGVAGSEELFPITLAARSINPFTSTIYLPELTHHIYLQAWPDLDYQKQATIYGLVLENFNASGILYHTIGVNSAQYRHYAKADIFAEQLQALRPDLVVISLGTNESVGYFSEGRFFSQVDDLVHDIEKYLPHAAIIFTTPPDAFYQGKVNANVNQCRNVLLDYAFDNDLSCWDLYEIMGGTGSVDRWHYSGLAGRDRLHFTKSGYELQGKLLFDAIMKGYDAYLTGK